MRPEDLNRPEVRPPVVSDDVAREHAGNWVALRAGAVVVSSRRKRGIFRSPEYDPTTDALHKIPKAGVEQYPIAWEVGPKDPADRRLSFSALKRRIRDMRDWFMTLDPGDEPTGYRTPPHSFFDGPVDPYINIAREHLDARQGPTPDSDSEPEA